MKCMLMQESVIGPLVKSAFRRHGYSQLERVECEAKNTTAILSGELPTFHLKQVAQTIALSVPQVTHVDNRIVVTSENGSNDDD